MKLKVYKSPGIIKIAMEIGNCDPRQVENTESCAPPKSVGQDQAWAISGKKDELF